MDTPITSLGEALPVEIKYVRNVVIPAYEEMGRAGAFALLLIKADLVEAEDAVISGDVVRMLNAYNTLKGIQL